MLIALAESLGVAVVMLVVLGVGYALIEVAGRPTELPGAPG